MNLKFFAVCLILLLVLTLSTTPLLVAKNTPTDNDQNPNTQDVKKLLDSQILDLLGLSTQVTTVESSIDLTADGNSFNYNATFVSENKTYSVSEGLLQTTGKQENQTIFSQNMVDDSGTFEMHTLGVSKSTIVKNNLINNEATTVIFRNNSETKNLNYSVQSTTTLDTKKTIASELEICQNITGSYYRSIVTPLNSNDLQASKENSKDKQFSMIMEDENGTCKSATFGIGMLPSNSIAERNNNEYMTLDDPPTISPTLADQQFICVGANVNGFSWLVIGCYVYWSDALNGAIDWAAFTSGLFLSILNWLAENAASTLLGLGVVLPLSAILVTLSPFVGTVLAAMGLVVSVASCFPADLGGEYTDMSVMYFETGFVFLTSTFALPGYMEEGFYSNYWRYYPGGTIHSCDWTYFDAFDSAEGPVCQIESWFTGAANHQSAVPTDLPCILDPYVTMNSYNEAGSSTFNGIPVYINGTLASTTCGTVFIPPGVWTVEVPAYNTFDYLVIGSTPVYSNFATFTATEGNDFTITAYYTSIPTFTVTVYAVCGWYDLYPNVYLDSNWVGTAPCSFYAQVGTHTIAFDNPTTDTLIPGDDYFSCFSAGSTSHNCDPDQISITGNTGITVNYNPWYSMRMQTP
jgi:hypothetical protein